MEVGEEVGKRKREGGGGTVNSVCVEDRGILIWYLYVVLVLLLFLNYVAPSWRLRPG